MPTVGTLQNDVQVMVSNLDGDDTTEFVPKEYRVLRAMLDGGGQELVFQRGTIAGGDYVFPYMEGSAHKVSAVAVITSLPVTFKVSVIGSAASDSLYGTHFLLASESATLTTLFSLLTGFPIGILNDLAGSAVDFWMGVALA